ncbi:hypothetical protein HDV00_005329 [Rhizophlyctis rosea]|nr:hypothetical protein HDV00_005329 [Rhizophlyctis rosea]
MSYSSDTILFYRGNEIPYGIFSNFYRAPIDLDGQTWPTTEHYFQAMKFPTSPNIQELIRNAETPGEAARLGRKRSYPLRPDWEEVKDGVMKRCLIAKFEQYPELKKVLMGTGERKLVEHTRNDRYWADGGDGSGRNMLGILLMEIRGEMRVPKQVVVDNEKPSGESSGEAGDWGKIW